MKKIFTGFLLTILLLASCKPSIPEEYIQPSELEAILTDYHRTLAVVMNQELPYDSLRSRVCLEAVLKKHGFTGKQYDESMIYYMRHTEHMKKVYDAVADRLAAEAVALGGSANDFETAALNSLNGDTTNIWSGERAIVLMHYAANNIYSFSYNADTTYLAGDAFTLNVETKFLFQDGVRDGIMVLAMQLTNDSVISRVIHMNSSTQYRLDIRDDKRQGIKKVSGYFMLNQNKNLNTDSKSTLKLMVLSKISLVRIHQKMVEPVVDKAAEKNDSLATDSTKEKKDLVEAKQLPVRTKQPPIITGRISGKPAPRLKTTKLINQSNITEQ